MPTSDRAGGDPPWPHLTFTCESGDGSTIWLDAPLTTEPRIVVNTLAADGTHGEISVQLSAEDVLRLAEFAARIGGRT